MKKITRKKHLEIKLESIPPHPNPKVSLEQYTTPSTIASDLIWNAYTIGDICNRKIIDLGCGTGILSVASALMNAQSVLGLDIDTDSINLACEMRDKFGLECLNFIVGDIEEFSNNYDVDTIIQNPPFGSQKMTVKGQDLKFVEKAIQLNPNVLYSFHMASSEEFLINYYKNNNLNISHIFRYMFPIPKIYDFHKNEVQNVSVIVIRAQL